MLITCGKLVNYAWITLIVDLKPKIVYYINCRIMGNYPFLILKTDMETYIAWIK
jgi:hypothetical protein